MDKNWSEMNKEIQALLSKEATLSQAIEKLISFRADMFEQIRQIVMSYPEEAFWQMPFAGSDGYHSKTLGYSIWHIFRIEDIVTHEMIADDPQVLLHTADSRAAIAFLASGAVPAGQSITPALLLRSHRTVYAPTSDAAGIMDLTDAMNATVWNPARKVFMFRPTTVRMRRRPRRCISGSMGKRSS